MTLTQAVLSNWQGESANDLIGAALGAPWAGAFPDDKRITLVDHLDPPSALANGPGYGIYNGLFRQTTPQKYSRDTHIQLPAEAFERFIWALDFHASYRAMLDRYWSAHWKATGPRRKSPSSPPATNRRPKAACRTLRVNWPGRRQGWRAPKTRPRCDC